MEGVSERSGKERLSGGVRNFLNISLASSFSWEFPLNFTATLDHLLSTHCAFRLCQLMSPSPDLELVLIEGFGTLLNEKECCK